MKWVEHSPNHYRMVPDEDPRPAVDLPNKPGSPMFVQSPPWAVHEAAAHSDDTESQVRGTDAFLAERAKWTADGGKWARHEKGRKDYLASQKDAFLKKRRKAK